MKKEKVNKKYRTMKGKRKRKKTKKERKFSFTFVFLLQFVIVSFQGR